MVTIGKKYIGESREPSAGRNTEMLIFTNCCQLNMDQFYNEEVLGATGLSERPQHFHGFSHQVLMKRI